jgi:hypothetical protein
MKRIIWIIGVIGLLPIAGSTQIVRNRTSQYIDVAGTVGASQGTIATSFVHNWKVGKAKKLELGIGGRVTGYFGSKKDFITAGPAKYTRSFTVPFIIFFAGQEEQNFDTLSVQRPFTVSLNAMVNLGYNFSPKWYAGFNIDVIGFTLGRKSSSVYTGDGITKIDPASKPSPFNLLLTGDHDIGTLNSEFYVRYQFAPRWTVRALYQFIFVEYQSKSFRQSLPDNNTNDRFRNKANNFGLGVSYFFKK